MIALGLDDYEGPRPLSESRWGEEHLRLKLPSRSAAFGYRVKVLKRLFKCETVADIDAYWEGEQPLIEQVRAWVPELAAIFQDTYEMQRACLMAGAHPSAAEPRETGAPVIAQSQERMTMFINTGDTGGSKGPWITWTSNGSAMKGFQPSKWVLRGKDDAGNKFETMVPGFEKPCVVDLDTLKLGWEKDGAQGQAPERRWNPTLDAFPSRPDESKKPSGAYAWTRAVQVRVALNQTEAATWEQGSFAAYSAFESLAKQINAQIGDHPGMLPAVQQTGVEQLKLTSGSANIPTLTIVKWVPRPNVLKEDAPQIATGGADPFAAATLAQQAAAPAPAPQPAPAATMQDDEIPF